MYSTLDIPAHANLPSPIKDSTLGIGQSQRSFRASTRSCVLSPVCQKLTMRIKGYAQYRTDSSIDRASSS
ncbi:hypothetical protein I79_012435 [Cricetulus griseus]|uniref:Uncharacterized protein n=1 Tax=Cricetulus griseus TaxID=10029 RepID=G3HNU1_CRIGR|nr:hypothetical protein I79_012435 [Cricetulus griseus]